jgi:hypothetical protein
MKVRENAFKERMLLKRECTQNQMEIAFQKQRLSLSSWWDPHA